MKNQKGITLVALVITIVVLLILAGVTISMVMGDNGVLNNSQKAKDNSAKGTAEDALSTALGSISTSEYAEGNTPSNLDADVLATKLGSSAPGYTYTVTKQTNNNVTTFNVTMSQKNSSFVFQAIVTDQLTVNSFAMTAGAKTNENAIF